VGIIWILWLSLKKYSIGLSTYLAETCTVVELRMEAMPGLISILISVTMFGSTKYLVHSVPRYQKLMDFVKIPPCVTVLPRRQWQRNRRVAPNWLVRSCGVPYSPERSQLSFAENTQKWIFFFAKKKKVPWTGWCVLSMFSSAECLASLLRCTYPNVFLLLRV